MVIALRLAKAGYWGGDPEKVLEARVDMVMAAAGHETFLADYERAFIRLNRERA